MTGITDLFRLLLTGLDNMRETADVFLPRKVLQ